jgi:hypothetical protein
MSTLLSLKNFSLIATKSETTANNVSSVMDTVSTLSSDLKVVESVLSRNHDRTSYMRSMIEQSVPRIRGDISTVLPQIQSTLSRIELNALKAASENSNTSQALTVTIQDIERVEGNFNSSWKTQDERMELIQERLSSIHQSQFQQLAYMGSLVSPDVDRRPLLELTAGREREIRSLRRLPIPNFDALGRISDDRGWPQFTVRLKAYRNKHKARPLLPSMVARKFKI